MQKNLERQVINMQQLDLSTRHQSSSEFHCPTRPHREIDPNDDPSIGMAPRIPHNEYGTRSLSNNAFDGRFAKDGIALLAMCPKDEEFGMGRICLSQDNTIVLARRDFHFNVCHMAR
jgi:hypothetical protein